MELPTCTCGTTLAIVKVVVVPDTLGAWIGLAGVVVGALATGGLNGLLAVIANRGDRRRTLDRAIGDLRASAASLL